MLTLSPQSICVARTVPSSFFSSRLSFVLSERAGQHGGGWVADTTGLLGRRRIRALAADAGRGGHGRCEPLVRAVVRVHARRTTISARPWDAEAPRARWGGGGPSKVFWGGARSAADADARDGAGGHWCLTAIYAMRRAGDGPVGYAGYQECGTRPGGSPPRGLVCRVRMDGIHARSFCGVSTKGSLALSLSLLSSCILFPSLVIVFLDTKSGADAVPRLNAHDQWPAVLRGCGGRGQAGCVWWMRFFFRAGVPPRLEPVDRETARPGLGRSAAWVERLFCFSLVNDVEQYGVIASPAFATATVACARPSMPSSQTGGSARGGSGGLYLRRSPFEARDGVPMGGIRWAGGYRPGGYAAEVRARSASISAHPKDPRERRRIAVHQPGDRASTRRGGCLGAVDALAIPQRLHGNCKPPLQGSSYLITVLLLRLYHKLWLAALQSPRRLEFDSGPYLPLKTCVNKLPAYCQWQNLRLTWNFEFFPPCSSQTLISSAMASHRRLKLKLYQNVCMCSVFTAILHVLILGPWTCVYPNFKNHTNRCRSAAGFPIQLQSRCAAADFSYLSSDGWQDAEDLPAGMSGNMDVSESFQRARRALGWRSSSVAWVGNGRDRIRNTTMVKQTLNAGKGEYLIFFECGSFEDAIHLSRGRTPILCLGLADYLVQVLAAGNIPGERDPA
ncbi:hypothetical protein B0H19DRAFT_1077224 [Mycena capillaripes]|nr:hypothetical protein B0H19DRAFT_1077224 [Mycena capillaripes]